VVLGDRRKWSFGTVTQVRFPPTGKRITPQEERFSLSSISDLQMFQENTSHLEFTVLKEFLKNTSGVAAGVEGESADSLSSRDNSLPHTTTHCTMLRHTATRCNIETTRLLPSQQRKCQRPWVYFRDKKPSEPRTTSVRDFKCQRYGCQSLQISETPNVRDYESQRLQMLTSETPDVRDYKCQRLQMSETMNVRDQPFWPKSGKQWELRL